MGHLWREGFSGQADRPGDRILLRWADNGRGGEAEKFFERGRQAEADGKPNVARIYYQMAVRRASGDLKKQALARLEAVAGPQPSEAIAQNAQ